MNHKNMWRELGLNVSYMISAIGAALAADNMPQACKEVSSLSRCAGSRFL
jgi:hypothetical protein